MKLKITVILLLIVQLNFGQNKALRIDSLLTALYNEGKFNGNVLIAEKGKVIYNGSFGLANETSKEKLNENSIFELASISKQFTAMGIVILKEQGKLSLDDKIIKYLPELSSYNNISIRNLLNHTSGLPELLQLGESSFAKEYYLENLVGKTATNDDIIAMLAKYNPKVVFEPNTKTEYNNTGYILLASIIERITGLTYAEFLNQAIFKPLEMNNTSVNCGELNPMEIPNYAFGYVYSDSLKKYVLPDSLKETSFVSLFDGFVGDAGVNSTINDLLKWDQSLYTNKLVSKSSIKEIFQETELSDKTIIPYGFGWFLEYYPEFGKIARHGGLWLGYVNSIERHIDNDKTIIILQNHTPASIFTKNSNISDPTYELRQILYNKPLRKEITLSNEQLQKLVGIYEIQKGVEVKITIDNGQLIGQVTGQIDYPLFPESELLFFLKAVDAQLQFEKNEGGEINSLYIIQYGNKTKALKTK